MFLEIFMIIVGIILFLGGIWDYIDTKKLIRNSSKVTGKIIHIIRVNRTNHNDIGADTTSTTEHPVIEYYINGECFVYNEHKSSRKSIRREGDNIEKLYGINNTFERTPNLDYSNSFIPINNGTKKRRKKYNIGDSIELLYDINDYTNVKINTFEHLWLQSIITIPIGALFFILSICSLLGIK